MIHLVANPPDPPSESIVRSPPMKSILVALTNIPTYGEKNAATGLWLGEAAEFVDEVGKRGYAVDYVSPQGGYVPLDPRSCLLYTSRCV